MIWGACFTPRSPALEQYSFQQTQITCWVTNSMILFLLADLHLGRTNQCLLLVPSGGPWGAVVAASHQTWWEQDRARREQQEVSGERKGKGSLFLTCNPRWALICPQSPGTPAVLLVCRTSLLPMSAGAFYPIALLLSITMPPTSGRQQAPSDRLLCRC